MKVKNIALVAAMSLGFTASALAADGTINFTGEIIDAACVVDSSSANLSVDLGKVSKSAFTSVGDTAGAKQFSIALTSCPDSVKTVASVFDGTPAGASNDLLATTGTSVGVAIGLYESDSSTKLSVLKQSKSVTIASGAAKLDYVAKYVATAAKAGITVGTANATTTYTLVYQ